RRVHRHIAAPGEKLVQRLGRSVHELRVDDVFRMLRGRILTVLDRPEIVRRREHAFRQQESRRELAVGPGCPHDDRERLVVQPDFERLFSGRAIAIVGAHAGPDSGDAYAVKGFGHGAHCNYRMLVMADAASFDITSPVDFAEVDNALNQARKEIGQRYDFKGATAEITLNATEKTLTLLTDDEMKMNAVWEIVLAKLVKR